MSEALSTGQQVFNQRLLAAHCMSELEAVELYESLQEQHDDLRGARLTDTIGVCNTQLQYLGLEIVAVNMPSEEEGDDANNKKKSVRHYALVNKFPDDISKICFQAHLFQPPEQQAYVKAVLQKLVDDASESEATSRATLLNLNRDAQIPLTSAEDCLDRLLEEKWLTTSCRGKRRMTNQTAFQLGPRSYCELSYLLTDAFGMEPSALPQQIVLR